MKKLFFIFCSIFVLGIFWSCEDAEIIEPTVPEPEMTIPANTYVRPTILLQSTREEIFLNEPFWVNVIAYSPRNANAAMYAVALQFTIPPQLRIVQVNMNTDFITPVSQAFPWGLMRNDSVALSIWFKTDNTVAPTTADSGIAGSILFRPVAVGENVSFSNISDKGIWSTPRGSLAGVDAGKKSPDIIVVPFNVRQR